MLYLLTELAATLPDRGCPLALFRVVGARSCHRSLRPEQPEAPPEHAPRAQADLPLQLSPTAQAQPARLKNISESGLCCHFEEPSNEMTQMAIDLELPGDEPRRVQGIVVRCEKQTNSPSAYEIAIYFTEMESGARQAIQDFVMNRPQER